jgi:hypothetical protein
LVDLFNVTYANGRFLAVGYGESEDFSTFLSSADGTNWSQLQFQTTNSLISVAYGNGQYVTVGGGGVAGPGWTFEASACIFSSPDGTNWVSRVSPTTNGLNAVAFGGSQFVAVGGWRLYGANSGSATILTSTNGENWVQRTAGTTKGLYAVVYGNGHFVAVGGWAPPGGIGGFADILTSSDGMDWIPCQSGATNALLGVAYGEGRFVAVGGGGTVVVSTDGINWTPHYLPNQSWFSGISYGSGQFVAVTGDDSGIATSADGIHWAERDSGTTSWLSGIAYGDGHFVAVGSGGTILESRSVVYLQLSPNSRPGSLDLLLNGPTGSHYTVQASSDLIIWQNLTNFTSAQSTTVIPAQLIPSPEKLFYRAYAQ